MSLPTIYAFQNAVGGTISQAMTQKFSWFPLTRARDKRDYDIEAGEMIVKMVNELDDAGPDKTKLLYDVSCLVSPGGKVPRKEFGDCVERFIENQNLLRQQFSASSSVGNKNSANAWLDGNVESAQKTLRVLARLGL